MTISEISSTLIRGEQAIKWPLKYLNNGFISDATGKSIMAMRWDDFKFQEGRVIEKLEDDIAIWLVATLNKAYEEEVKNGQDWRKKTKTLLNTVSKNVRL